MSEIDLAEQLRDLRRRVAVLERRETASGVTTAHTHAKLVASDGSPDPAVSADATGNLTAVASAIIDKALILTDGGELTISAGGAITVTASRHNVDTYEDAATDNLDTINGGADGQLLFLRSTASARDPKLRDGEGNLALAGDCTLDSSSDTILLINRGGQTWFEVARSDNG